MRHATIGVLTIALLGCGARSDLALAPDATVVGPRDAGPRTDASRPRDGGIDAGVDASEIDPPSCEAEVPVGAIRGTVEDIDSRPAIDDAGNLYALREAPDAEGEWFVVSYDPCLRVRWVVPLVGEVRGLRRGRVMVDGRGDVWVVARGPGEVWRFSSEGAPLPVDVPRDEILFTWIGVPDEGGPVLATDGARGRQLHRVDSTGGVRSVALPEETTYVYEDECFALADTIGCVDVAFDRESLTQLFRTPSPRLIDGTFRHPLPPASDGALTYVVEYGISTYRLRVRETRTGAERALVTLARSTRGQSNLLVGPPVLTEGGLVVLYLSTHRDDGEAPGQLEAFTRDGAPAWSFAAPRTRRREDPYDGIYSGEATHVAGRGAIYLAVGASVYAIDDRDGALLWQLEGLGDLNEPGTNLSPNGELYVRSVDGVLTAIRTASPGLARSSWPAPGGGHRLNRSN